MNHNYDSEAEKTWREYIVAICKQLWCRELTHYMDYIEKESLRVLIRKMLTPLQIECFDTTGNFAVPLIDSYFLFVGVYVTHSDRYDILYSSPFVYNLSHSSDPLITELCVFTRSTITEIDHILVDAIWASVCPAQYFIIANAFPGRDNRQEWGQFLRKITSGGITP